MRRRGIVELISSLMTFAMLKLPLEVQYNTYAYHYEQYYESILHSQLSVDYPKTK